MALLDLNWHPSRRQLRQFGSLCGLLLPVLGWWWPGGWPGIGVGIGLGALIAGLALALPDLIRPLFLGATVITAPIGLVLGELSLIAIFCLIFLPLGIVFRLLRRDRLQLSRNEQQPSYWLRKPEDRSSVSYYRQA